jgi:hypothetical protein
MGSGAPFQANVLVKKRNGRDPRIAAVLTNWSQQMDELHVAHPPDGLPTLASQLALLTGTATAMLVMFTLSAVNFGVAIAVIAAAEADAKTLFVLLHHRLLVGEGLEEVLPERVLLLREGEVVVARQILGFRRIDHRHAESRPEILLGLRVGDFVRKDEIRMVVEAEVGTVTFFAAVHLIQRVKRQRVAVVEEVRSFAVAEVSEMIQSAVRHGTSPSFWAGCGVQNPPKIISHFN